MEFFPVFPSGAALYLLAWKLAPEAMIASHVAVLIVGYALGVARKR
jgi:uncharacterized membrane protein YjjP (DUF1212 family)